MSQIFKDFLISWFNITIAWKNIFLVLAIMIEFTNNNHH
jgi:hypothetical protein